MPAVLRDLRRSNLFSWVTMKFGELVDNGKGYWSVKYTKPTISSRSEYSFLMKDKGVAAVVAHDACGVALPLHGRDGGSQYDMVAGFDTVFMGMKDKPVKAIASRLGPDIDYLKAFPGPERWDLYCSDALRDLHEKGEASDFEHGRVETRPSSKQEHVPVLLVGKGDVKRMFYDLFIASPAFVYVRQWDPA